MFFHGGGFVIGDLEIYDSVAREIAIETGYPVLSVDYGLAPEEPFPAAPDDCLAAARWAAGSPSELGFTVTGLALTGDSAGGNLSIVTALDLRDAPAAVPLLAIAPMYPVVDDSNDLPSMTQFAEGYLLSAPDMKWFGRNYGCKGGEPRHHVIDRDLTDLPPTLLNLNIHATDPEVMEKFTLWVYNAPWSRASPYLVGLALGLVLGGAVNVPSPSRLVSGLLWTLSTAVALLVVLGMWNYNSHPEEQWSTGVAVSYAALHRLAWGLCIAWVIWACASGRGGPVDAFLSHPVWRPLSRLTYAPYLTSIQIMVWYAGLVREPVSCGHLYLIYWFLADLCLTFAVAAVFSLAFEWPMAALERAARERSARTTTLAAATAAIFTSTAAERRSSQDSGIHVISVSKRDFGDGND